MIDIKKINQNNPSNFNTPYFKIPVGKYQFIAPVDGAFLIGEEFVTLKKGQAYLFDMKEHVNYNSIKETLVCTK